MRALDTAIHARQLAEKARAPYAIFLNRDGFDLVPVNGCRYRKLKDCPQRSALELAVVSADSDPVVVSAKLRDARG
jgi:hypothetical protein